VKAQVREQVTAKSLAVRRALVFLAFSALLVGALPARAQAPSVGATPLQFAEAIWIDLDSAAFYFGAGFRFVDEDGTVQSWGSAGKGICFMDKFGGGTMFSCVASGAVYDVGMDGFTIDPAMRSAHLEFDADRYHQVVDWTGKGAPSVAAAQQAGSWGADVAAQASSEARATATIDGAKMRRGRGFAFAGFAQGAQASTHLDYEFQDDGTVTVRFRFER
jgi:hypothetical protein